MTLKFDHVALVSNNINDSVKWYVDNLSAKIIYQDDTWGFVEVAGTKIAFVMQHQHPPHICFEPDDSYIESNLKDRTFKKHRDGTSSCYITDCDGNFIEFLVQNDTSNKK